MYRLHAALLATIALLPAPPAFAQSSPPRERPAEGALALPSHASPFANYRAYRDEERAVWRDVNDEVGRVGGHIGILRAEQADAVSRPAAPETARSAPPQPAREGGHVHGHR